MTPVYMLSNIDSIVQGMINHMAQQVDNPKLRDSKFVFDSILYTVSGQNPPGQNPPGQNPPDKIPLDKIPPRTKSPQDKIPLDKIPPVYFIFY